MEIWDACYSSLIYDDIISQEVDNKRQNLSLLTMFSKFLQCPNLSQWVETVFSKGKSSDKPRLNALGLPREPHKRGRPLNRGTLGAHLN